MNVFTVTFDRFNASLLNKIKNILQNPNLELFIYDFWYLAMVWDINLWGDTFEFTGV